MAARWRRAAPTRSLQNCWALTPPSGAYQPAKCSKGTLGELDIIDESEPTKGTLFLKPKPSLKTGTANGIYWNSLGLFRDYDLNYIFWGNKTFFFIFQDRKLKFSASVKKNFVKPHKISTQSDNGYKKNVHKNCLNELNELKFKNKQKSFIPKKNVIYVVVSK